MKVCNKCKVEKKLEEFHKGNDKDGFQYTCKLCKKEYSQKNKEKENIRKTKWRLKNPEKIKKSKHKYYSTNKVTENKRNTNYSNNKKKIDPLFKISCNLRTRIYNYIKSKKIKKTNTTYDLIGCSPSFLKEHLEKQFSDGMSWEIMGRYIHIDHIIPLSSAKTEEDFFKLCHYTNLQPLWAVENLRKGKKIMYF